MNKNPKKNAFSVKNTSLLFLSQKTVANHTEIHPISVFFQMKNR
ncbi:hypothetical protein EZS27_026852 [termite gut metagenome]|uniref:Uncharacterized protein n=1 Tax=termite gut metagenome TaxID=433724 RepID=A0A5J4QS87_9ZZZZ